MNNLQRRYFKNDGANKYHIDCAKLEQKTESIDVVMDNVIQNVNDVSILRAVLTDDEITKKYRNIVIKIGKVNKTIEKEYQTGKILENANMIGFINFMCIFNCYDDTFENIKKNKLKTICNGEKTDDQKKTVLIMPFIKDGSIKNFNWSTNNFDILKSVLQQIVMSVLTAYEICGFLHNDLHLDNVLLKKTKKDIIVYEKAGIKTYGYKIVIMDFDRSFIHVDIKTGIEFYWLNLYNVLSRVNSDLEKPNGNKIIMNNMTKITTFIENQRINKKSHQNAIKLLDIINDSTFSILEKPKLVYNPNIY
jgi:hypothetical protein